jgi:hypothetical protein
MNFRITQIVPAFLMLFLLGSCGPTVKTTKTARVDLSKYQSFAWLPTKEDIKNPDYNNELVLNTILAEVNTEMRDHGYRMDQDDPDLLLKVKTMFDKETETVRNPVYGNYTYSYPYRTVNSYYDPYYYRGYSRVSRVVGYDVDQITYTEGTFVIDIIDAKKDQVIWRGWSQDRVAPENLKLEIANYVDEIFDEYPLDRKG